MKFLGSASPRVFFSFFPHGRLFWKFLVFFFLAQMTAVLGVGLAIWATMPEHPSRPPAFAPPRLAPPDVSEPGMPALPARSPRAPPPHPPQPGPELPLIHLGAGAVVSLIFATLLAAYVSRPIRRLREAMQRGANGQLDTVLVADMGTRRDELADLSLDFDRMTGHLARLMAAQRRLLHDVSHEMRSPLARLNAIIGLVRQQPRDIEDYLSRLEHESMRMDRLLSELLTLSRLESTEENRFGELAEPVDLAELLEQVLEDAHPESELAACQIELGDGHVKGGGFVGATERCVRGDAELLYRLFDNLLRNALRHAASGGWIGVRLSATTEELQVCVEDRGPGVANADLDHLFEPFFRSGRGAGGHGLGLAIARQIAEKHRGRIDVANRPEGGFRVRVSLPRVACSGAIA